ncbi:MAG TPA: hypothetical protein VF614_15345 [Chthoniobacteraceae bacterium]|jgi:hypothetical protein
MNITLVSKISAVLAIASIALATTSTSHKRLTVQRIAEVKELIDAAPPRSYQIEVSGIGSIEVGPAKFQMQMEAVRALSFPTEFDPPLPAGKGLNYVMPATPTAFETVNTGWTVRLSGKPHGKLIEITGAADYTEAESLPGGYGEVAGPIYDARGDMVTTNKLDQPRLQTTTTRFHLFALPGKGYEILLYRGRKAEKHTVAVTAD